MAFLPTSNLGVPWVTGFSWKFVNYTILVFPACADPVVDLLARLGQELVHGPKHTIDVLPETPASSLP